MSSTKNYERRYKNAKEVAKFSGPSVIGGKIRSAGYVKSGGLNTKQYLFCSGLAVDFLCILPEIKKRFGNIQRAWAEVTSNEEGPLLADGSRGPPPEITCRAIAPNPNMVTDWVNTETARNTTARAARDAAINGAPNTRYNAAERAIALEKSGEDHAKREQWIADNTLNYENRLTQLQKIYDDKVKEHEKMMDAIHLVFTTSFGGQANTFIAHLLHEKRYREAWRVLNARFSAQAGGQAAIQAIMGLIHNAVFDAQKETLVDFVEKIRTWSNAVVMAQQGVDQVADDTTVLNSVINAIKRHPVHCKDYELTIKLVNRRRPEEDPFTMLYEQALEQQYAEYDKKTVNAEANVVNVREQTTKPRCHHCNRIGHMQKDCWQKVACGVCGKKGHGTKYCRSAKKSDGELKKAEKVDKKDASVKLSDNIKKLTAYVVLSFNDNYFTELKYRFIEVPKDSDESGLDICDMTVEHVPAAQCNRREMTSSCWCESDQFALSMYDCHINPALFLVNNVASDRVIIDSGATMHMFCNADLMKMMRKTEGMIKLGTDGISVPVKGIGSSNINVIDEVLFAPGLNMNILSVAALDNRGYQSTFGKGICTIYCRSSMSILLTGTEHNGLFYLDELYVQILFGETNLLSYLKNSGILTNFGYKRYGDDPEEDTGPEETEVVEPEERSDDEIDDDDDDIDWNKFDSVENYKDEYIEESMNSVTADLFRNAARYIESDNLNALEILHKKMGHASEGSIKRALKEELINDCEYCYNDIKDLSIRTCFECMKGRMKAFPRNPTTRDNWNTMEKIAIDFKGPFSIQSYHKKRGVMLISDYSSNYVYAYMVRTKAESVDALKEFHRSIVSKYGYTVKVLQSDADCIFKGKKVEKWLKLYNINLQLSAPYMHYQNGQIERDVQNVFDKVRTLLLSYDVPPKFWEFAVKTSVYLINRLPTTGRDVTPYEAVTGIRPSIAHYVPFWAPGVYHVTREERGRDPWCAKAQEVRMLGYDENNNGVYEVYNLETRRVLTRGNCIFDPHRILEELEEEPDREEMEITEGRDDIDIFQELREEQEDIIEVESDNDESVEEMDVVTDREGYNQSVPVTVGKGYDQLKDDEDSGNESGVTDSESLFHFAGMSYWHKKLYFTISKHERWKNDVFMLNNKVKPLPPNPLSVEDAINGPDGEQWKIAIDEEVMGFLTRNLWEFAEDERKGDRTMKTKFILTYKYTSDYKIKCKARLVVCGYSQIKGLDYIDTFSPTTTTALIFYILHISSVYKLYRSTFDVSAAFLEGDSEVELYAWLPPCIIKSGERQRVKINGNWYGEKQAGRVWNKKFDSIMRTMGFERCPMMPCFYKKDDGKDRMFVLVHVDDGLLLANRKELFKIFMDEFLKHITKAVHNIEFNQYLKMSIEELSDGRVLVSQCEYIDSHFKQAIKKVHTPMSMSVNLRVQPHNPLNESLLPDTGRFRYLADRTRADILVTTSEISIGGAAEPSDEHLKARDRLIDYIIATKEVSLILGGSDPIQLFGYSDAAYITDGNAKSRLGGCLFLGMYSGAFHSYSRSDTIKSSISHSSTEAEIKAIDELSREVEYWLEILEFTGVTVELPVKIFVDNKSAIELCRVLKTTHQVKHINSKINYINDLITRGIVELLFVLGEYNVADLLTKGLDREAHERHTEVLLHGHGGVFWNEMMKHVMYMADIVVDELTEIMGVCHDPVELEAGKG